LTNAHPGTIVHLEIPCSSVLRESGAVLGGFASG
jgi:hypothetical protein